MWFSRQSSCRVLAVDEADAAMLLIVMTAHDGNRFLEIDLSCFKYVAACIYVATCWLLFRS